MKKPSRRHLLAGLLSVTFLLAVTLFYIFQNSQLFSNLITRRPEISIEDPYLGADPDTARIKLVVYINYQLETNTVQAALLDVLPKYQDVLSITFKQAPIDYKYCGEGCFGQMKRESEIEDGNFLAAEAVFCAHEQGYFEPFHNQLVRRTPSTYIDEDYLLDVGHFVSLEQTGGKERFNNDALADCLSSHKYKRYVINQNLVATIDFGSLVTGREIAVFFDGEKVGQLSRQNGTVAFWDEYFNQLLNPPPSEPEEGWYMYNMKNQICTVPPEEIMVIDPYQEPNYTDPYVDEYFVRDNCLYYQGHAVYEKNLYAQISAGEFGELPESQLRGGAFGQNPIQELFRYEHEGKLRIFLMGSSDCGGCGFSGPYLEIVLSTGEIRRKMADLPYFYNLELSPNKKLAVLVEIKYPERDEAGEVAEGTMEEEYYLYDLVNFKKGKKLYAPKPGERTLLSCGMGCSQSGIEWLDNQFIQLTPRKLTELDIPYIGYPDEEAAEYDKPFVISAF